MPLVIVLGILKGNSAIERVLQRFPQNVGVLYKITYYHLVHCNNKINSYLLSET